MRIGINLLCILPGVNGGVETYSRLMLKALAERYSEDRYFVFLNRQGAAMEGLASPNIEPVICDFDGRSRELRYAWEQLMLPRKARQFRLDVLHSPGYQGPLRCSSPTVVTVPDLNFYAFRDTMAWHRRTALRFFSSRAARSAARVITISAFSKGEIVRSLGIPEDGITVTPLGPGVPAAPSDWEAIRARYRLTSPYIVAFAGNNHPHKNIARLLDAFDRLRTAHYVNIAIIGSLSRELRQAGEKLADRMQELGFVENAAILPILSHARLCVLPSLYEGFGLPVLEAQSAGVPLACSTAASLPEVAGERGASFFQPESVDEMTAAIESCLSNQEYSDALVNEGRRNLARFSWARTADETRAVYSAVAEAPR